MVHDRLQRAGHSHEVPDLHRQQCPRGALRWEEGQLADHQRVAILGQIRLHKTVHPWPSVTRTVGKASLHHRRVLTAVGILCEPLLNLKAVQPVAVVAFRLGIGFGHHRRQVALPSRRPARRLPAAGLPHEGLAGSCGAAGELLRVPRPRHQHVHRGIDHFHGGQRKPAPPTRAVQWPTIAPTIPDRGQLDQVSGPQLEHGGLPRFLPVLVHTDQRRTPQHRAQRQVRRHTGGDRGGNLREAEGPDLVTSQPTLPGAIQRAPIDQAAVGRPSEEAQVLTDNEAGQLLASQGWVFPGTPCEHTQRKGRLCGEQHGTGQHHGP
mmetsp:Transcript_86906/g.280744  ORF Transcript_86906/g.280744 Transcript_86906/m.280744 type:complete len:321 (+) Transcript_86906:212-1174(+)